MRQKRNNLLKVYKEFYNFFGPQRWWPADSPFEVMIGAILTQNTSWSNVEKAIRNLKEKKMLNPLKIEKASLSSLRSLIKPSGFFNQKAKRLKGLAKFISLKAGGKVETLTSHETSRLRKMLLDIPGVGPETADSILLYAFNKPVFVVDAYTKRIFSRHKMVKKDADYEDTKRFFIDNLPHNRQLFNEFHALIVEVGKNFCRKKNPLCKLCPFPNKGKTDKLK